MKKMLLGLMVMLSASCLQAALSPLEQSIKEITAIVQSQEIREKLKPSETILDIWKVGGRYVVSTENRQMSINIIYSPRDLPGPQDFKLVFYDPIPYGK